LSSRAIASALSSVVALWAGLVLGQAPAASPAPETPTPTPAPQPGSVVVSGGGSSVVVTPAPGGGTEYAPAPGSTESINQSLPSGSRPKYNIDEGDTFDLEPRRGGGGVVYGSKGAAGVVAEELTRRPVSVPAVHLVRRGDTLWDLCDYYFRNPWAWPKVWSFNPQIANPHWIYPGDQIRMRDVSGETPETLSPYAGRPSPRTLGGAKGLGARARIPKNTVFLRDQGFIGDPKRDTWGELVGAVEDQMLLADGNRVYLQIRPGVDVRAGQELTVFRPVRQPEKVPGARKPPGEIVAVKGTIRIDRFDPKTRIARGEIVESVDVIERGAKVGPVGRRFDVVPPRKSEAEVAARVLTSFYPLVYIGQNQVAFLDRGSEDGLAPGNRLYVLRKGDTWRGSLETTSRMSRDRIRIDSPQNVEVESTPLAGDEKAFPEEVIAELLVLRTEKYSSLAMVTQSRREVVSGDLAVTRKGH
jgi:hypothetical protein